jgi:hypothetical protein
MNLVSIGYDNYVSVGRLVAVLQVGSSPVRRLIRESRDRGVLLDATTGKKTRSVIITDSGHVLLSAILPETVAERCRQARQGEAADE